MLFSFFSPPSVSFHLRSQVNSLTQLDFAHAECFCGAHTHMPFRREEVMSVLRHIKETVTSGL